MTADISVVIPARNEAARLIGTITSIARARTTDARLEFVVCDDHSDDDIGAQLRGATDALNALSRVQIKVHRPDERQGVPRARNYAAALATAELLVMTDAHVSFCEGWDDVVREHARPNRILAGTIIDTESGFEGYGCHLVVPFMGTHWNTERLDNPAFVQIASCAATALPRRLFEQLQGYDPGMRLYGAAEPEFSLRAWLHGAEILAMPELRVEHRFKPEAEREALISEMRPSMVHNSLRFGLLYLSEVGSYQMLRYHAIRFPNMFRKAIRMIHESDVWQRKAILEGTRQRTFEWFVDRFQLKDRIGGKIL